jgi:pimeloyl-ACP methyl ester carboxylesterase
MSARNKTFVGLAVVAATAAAVWGAEQASVRRSRRQEDPDALNEFMPEFDETHTFPSHDGGVINAISRGKGPVIVLSHGVTLSVRTWAKQMEFLPEAGFRSIAFDHRGHGGSVAGSTGHTIENLAWDVRTVLESMDLHDAVLVGHSMGGIAVLAFMVTFPEIAAERVSGIVMLSSMARTPLSGHEGLARFVGALSARGPDVTGLLNRRDLGYLMSRVGFGSEALPSHIELTREMVLECPPETRKAAGRALLNLDLVEQIASIRMPTLVIGGTADVLTPPAESRRMAATIPGASLEIVPRGGHMLMFERTELVNELISSFARRVQHSSASSGS